MEKKEYEAPIIEVVELDSVYMKPIYTGKREGYFWKPGTGYVHK